MPQRPRDNEWARAHGLENKTVVIYAGTLGLKHDPSVISDLAASMPTDSRLVVVSQGKGRQWLEENAGGEPRLQLLDYQPYEQLPDMLASADVLLVVLEHGASQYSVPSKVLNYLCAGRPVLAVMPEGNAAAEMLESAGAGFVVPPGNSPEAAGALHRLLADPSLREQMGRAARRYAEDVFDIAAVGARFETVVQDAYDRASRVTANSIVGLADI
jgi:glycosyltransferase involved in cell wall biosynthesis